MAKYSIDIRWSDEDEGYIASCPELDGVSAFGETPTEAATEAEAAINLALQTYDAEGWAHPEPRLVSQYSGQFRVRLPRSLHKWLVREAEDEGVSLNTYVVSRLSEARGEWVTLGVLAEWENSQVESDEYQWYIAEGAAEWDPSTPRWFGYQYIMPYGVQNMVVREAAGGLDQFGVLSVGGM